MPIGILVCIICQTRCPYAPLDSWVMIRRGCGGHAVSIEDFHHLSDMDEERAGVFERTTKGSSAYSPILCIFPPRVGRYRHNPWRMPSLPGRTRFSSCAYSVRGRPPSCGVSFQVISSSVW